MQLLAVSPTTWGILAAITAIQLVSVTICILDYRHGRRSGAIDDNTLDRCPIFWSLVYLLSPLIVLIIGYTRIFSRNT